MSPTVAHKVVASFHEQQQEDALSGLTAREREVLDLLTEGLAYKQIAGRLTISSNTVHQHLRRVYCKLGVQTRNDPRLYSRSQS